MAKHVDFGGILELSPVMWLYLKDDVDYTVSMDHLRADGSDTSKDYGFGAPSVNLNLYLTFIKFINMSVDIDYEYFRTGTHDVQISHDTTLRFGLALLKKPKSGFLNFLVGVFYEHEWLFMDMNDDHTYDHSKRWIFCIGASG